jgi:predicted porin
MKKTMLALAAMTAVSAFAQSNVTLYGRVDNWVGQVRTQSGTAPAVSNIVVDSSGHTGSRWGLRGSEDLGGGLKANFNLESGISTDTGALDAGALFRRQSWLGVSGGFGEIKIGRTTTPMDDYTGVGNAHLALDIFGNQRGTIRGELSGGFIDRFSNGIKYESPNLGGFTAAAHIGLGENKTATTKATNSFGVGVGYANGPLALGLSYMNEKPSVLPSTKADKHVSFDASFDLGVVALSGAVDLDSLPEKTKYRGYSLGATVPLGSANIGFGYNTGRTKQDGDTIAKGAGLGIVADYSLSKRTKVYGGITQVRFKDGTGVTTDKGRIVAVGVRHDF